MVVELSRGTSAKRHAEFKRIAWQARERGRRASWQFFSANPHRDLFARPAFQHEHFDNEEHGFPPAVVIAHRDAFFEDTLVTQVGLRAPPSLAVYVQDDRGEEFARSLRELAQGGDLQFTVGHFTVVAGRIVPMKKYA